MIERTGLMWDGFKARFYDPQLEKPMANGYKSEPIVLTDELLAEWDSKATEIVEAEPINDSEQIGKKIYGACELPLTILRVKHQDGRVNVEPVYRLFPLGFTKHFLMRNTLLEFTNVEWDVAESKEFNEASRNAPIRKQIPEWPIFTRPLWYERELMHMYCRKYDINMMQAKRRTSLFTPEQWEAEFNGKYDLDLCWRWLE